MFKSAVLLMSSLTGPTLFSMAIYAKNLDLYPDPDRIEKLLPRDQKYYEMKDGDCRLFVEVMICRLEDTTKNCYDRTGKPVEDPLSLVYVHGGGKLWGVSQDRYYSTLVKLNSQDKLAGISEFKFPDLGLNMKILILGSEMHLDSQTQFGRWQDRVPLKLETKWDFLPRGEITKNYMLDGFFGSTYYSVTCSPGTRDYLSKYENILESERDRLGPPGVWGSGNEASISKLPLGTVFKLKPELFDDEVYLKSYPYGLDYREIDGWNDEYLVRNEFKQAMRYRLASVEMHLADNSLISAYNFRYPKAGMKLRLTSIRRSHNERYEYILGFEPADSYSKVGTISWIRVVGRRSGRFDIVIPQLVELMDPLFDIELAQ